MSSIIPSLLQVLNRETAYLAEIFLKNFTTETPRHREKQKHQHLSAEVASTYAVRQISGGYCVLWVSALWL